MRESLRIVLADGSLRLSGQVSAPWVVTGVRAAVAGSDPERSFIEPHLPATAFAVDLDVDLLFRSLGANTGSYDLFLEVEGEGGRCESWRLGRFVETDRSAATDSIPAGDTATWVHVTEPGNVSLFFTDVPPRQAKADTQRLAIGPDGIALEQTLRTFSRPAVSAVGSWTQRESGARHEVPLELTARPTLHGLFSYDLRGTIPPPADAAAGDDVHDPFVEVRLQGVPDPVRVPIRPGVGRSAQMSMREIMVEHGDDRQILIPHLTFRGRRLAFWSETFSDDAYAYLRRLRWISWSFFLIRPFLRIWLVGETPYKAQDNGFAFFAWLRREHPNRRAYYVIEVDSPDLSKVESIGNVVLRHSRRHVLLTLLASRFVGSHDAEYLYASRSRPIVRRVGGIRVFLQHGVTAMKNVTLNYGLRRMVEAPPDVFCVNAPAEQQIVVDALEYRTSQVPITGFTRFDALLTPDVEVKPRILVMPTWRDWLSDRDAFVDSEFVRQWTNFLAGVVPIAVERGMTVDLVLHPNMRHHAALFAIDGVTVREPGDDLQTLLKSSRLLVTDYSSVGWDFSFLDRPVVYFQFDQARFTGGRPPYIDYGSQLPGAIASTSAAAVDLVATSADGRPQPDMRARSRAFLQHADHDACQRTYDVVRRADGFVPRLLRVRTAVLRRDLDRRARHQAGRVRRLVGRIVRRAVRAIRPTQRPTASAQLAALRPRIAAVPRDVEAAWAPLRSEVVVAASGLPSHDWGVLSLHDRIAAWLVVEDRRADLIAALVDIDRHGRSLRSVRDDPAGLARPGYLDALSSALPDWLLRPADGDLTLGLEVDQISAGERLHLHGAAYVRGMRFDAAEDSISLAIVENGARREVPLDHGVDPLLDPMIDTVSGDRWCSYAEAGFRAIVDPRPIRGAELEVTVTSGGVTRQRRVPLDFANDVPRAILTSVGSGGDGVNLGVAELPEGWHVAASGRLRPLDISGHAGEAVLKLVTDDGRAADSGRYEVHVVDADGAPGRLAIADELASILPIDGITAHVAWRLSVRDGDVELTIRSPLPAEERGRRNQRLLIDAVNERPNEIEPAILALSFSGRSTGDSVEPLTRELADRLGWPVRWGVTDHAVPVPAGTEPLLIHSRAWHESLAASRLLVNNAHFPAYFDKRPGQIYVQTWHGTPLKRIGNDVPAETLALSYRALMSREAAAWDVLLAQNPFAAETLPAAFGFAGEVLAEGYPRNDALTATGASAHRRAVRDSLGIAEGQTVVLYAPTWRDQAVTAANQAALVTYLDPVRLRAVAGDGVTVLLRGHSNTARGRSAASDVVDVTDHPDLPGLFLAADVLVTDYSSVMFDYCVTGGPIIFLTPDLAQYRDSTRGFYLDLAEIAPGPVVATTDEVAAHVRDLDTLAAQYAARYAGFVDRFAPVDDGGAARRVADRVEALLRNE
jgi:CDP-glycerol glycerophosphotransferase (TagB/SpsB family)